MTTPGPEVRGGVPTAAGTGLADEAVVEQARSEDEARDRQRRGRLVTAVVAAVLVLLVGVVALLGGFERRDDTVVPVPVGSTVTTGPYELTLTKGTLQRQTGEEAWEVRVTGTTRTTGDESISPSTGSDEFVWAKDLATGEVQKSYSVRLGDPDQLIRLDKLTPGLAAVPWTVVFRFDHEPTAPVTVVVFDLDYTTPYVFGDEEGWQVTSSGHRMEMPLTTLPPTTY